MGLPEGAANFEGAEEQERKYFVVSKAPSADVLGIEVNRKNSVLAQLTIMPLC